MAEELDYVPMPDKVVKDIEQTWASEDQGRQRQAALHGDELALTRGRGRRPGALPSLLLDPVLVLRPIGPL